MRWLFKKKLLLISLLAATCMCAAGGCSVFAEGEGVSGEGDNSSGQKTDCSFPNAFQLTCPAENMRAASSRRSRR